MRWENDELHSLSQQVNSIKLNFILIFYLLFRTMSVVRIYFGETKGQSIEVPFSQGKVVASMTMFETFDEIKLSVLVMWIESLRL